MNLTGHSVAALGRAKPGAPTVLATLTATITDATAGKIRLQYSAINWINLKRSTLYVNVMTTDTSGLTKERASFVFHLTGQIT